jgi:hypothetical protein
MQYNKKPKADASNPMPIAAFPPGSTGGLPEVTVFGFCGAGVRAAGALVLAEGWGLDDRCFAIGRLNCFFAGAKLEHIFSILFWKNFYYTKVL